MRSIRARRRGCDGVIDVASSRAVPGAQECARAQTHPAGDHAVRAIAGVAQTIATLGVLLLGCPPSRSAHAQQIRSSAIAVHATIDDSAGRSTYAFSDYVASRTSLQLAATPNARQGVRACSPADADTAGEASLPLIRRARPCTDGTQDTTDAGRSWFTPLRHMPVWATPIASALLPGLGQFRLHQDRFVAYMAAEAFAVLQYAKDRREGRDNASAYRAIARDIARRGFVAAPPDTVWQYYEKLEKFIESGAFTLSVNGPTVPETDPSTYNGFLWQQARMVYGVPLDDPGAVGSPRYQQALARYEETAVRQPYRWSWRNAQLEQDLFRQSIARSNDAYRRATTDLGVLIANHLLSSVDAFATVRLLQAGPGSYRVSAAIPVK